MIDQLEEKYGFKFEKLSAAEKESFLQGMNMAATSQITPEKMRTYVTSMREAVEKELVVEPEFNYIFIFKIPNRKQIFLKARLMNYLLLEGFLGTPERAKQAFEDAVSNMAKRIV